jgi:hypothetical protein
MWYYEGVVERIKTGCLVGQHAKVARERMRDGDVSSMSTAERLSGGAGRVETDADLNEMSRGDESRYYDYLQKQELSESYV